MATATKGARKKKTTPVDIEAIVIDRIVKKMQSTGKMMWQRSYKLDSVQGKGYLETQLYPTNPWTGTVYSGINVPLLWGGSGFYMTPNHIRQYNEKHKASFWFAAGTPHETVVYSKSRNVRITAEKASQLRSEGKGSFVIEKDGEFFQVFRGWIYHDLIDCIHLKDKEGKPFLKTTQAPPPTEEQRIFVHQKAQQMVESYMRATGVKQVVKPTTPHYMENGDYVSLPPMQTYRNQEVYYRDLFHELVHSTGVRNRLNRPEFAEYRNHKQRSREELVAEVGSMMLVAFAGFDPDGAEAENSANYVKSWCDWFKDNPKEMFRGFTETQKAVEYFQEQVKRGSGNAEQAPTETPQEEQVPRTRKELLVYLSKAAEANNQRGKRTFARIHKAEKVTALQAAFAKKVTTVEQLPVFSVTLPNKCTVDIGMTFAVYTTQTGEASILFSLDKGHTLLQAQQMANQLKHPGVAQLVSYMDLRKAIR